MPGGVFNPGAAESFVENPAPAYKDPTGSGAWENWDISAIISGAKAVLVVADGSAIPASNQAGVRSDGSARTLTFQSYYQPVTFIVEPVADIIEIYSQTNTSGNFLIMGWWI